MPNEITQKTIREITRACAYCDKKVKWFCPNCWFGVCDDCADEEMLTKCAGDCHDKLPDLGDIEIFKKK